MTAPETPEPAFQADALTLGDWRPVGCRLTGWAPSPDQGGHIALSIDGAVRMYVVASIEQGRALAAALIAAADAITDEVIGVHGRCDSCGAPCDTDGCTRDRAHVAADPRGEYNPPFAPND